MHRNTLDDPIRIPSVNEGVPEELKNEHNHDHDAITNFRAYASFLRTFLEHATLWGSLVDLAFGFQALLFISGWGWVVGIAIGLIIGGLDAYCHRLEDSANDEQRQNEIGELIKKDPSKYKNEVQQTSLSWLDTLAIKAHIHDQETINWAYWLYTGHIALTAVLGTSSSVMSYVFGFNPYPIVERLAALVLGLFVGYGCSIAEERTVTNRVKTYRWWEENHKHLADAQPQIPADSKMKTRSRSWPNISFWNSPNGASNLKPSENKRAFQPA